MAKRSRNECDCPIIYTLAVVGGKWKWVIIYQLYENRDTDLLNIL